MLSRGTISSRFSATIIVLLITGIGLTEGATAAPDRAKMSAKAVVAAKWLYAVREDEEGAAELLSFAFTLEPESAAAEAARKAMANGTLAVRDWEFLGLGDWADGILGLATEGNQKSPFTFLLYSIVDRLTAGKEPLAAKAMQKLPKKMSSVPYLLKRVFGKKAVLIKPKDIARQEDPGIEWDLRLTISELPELKDGDIRDRKLENPSIKKTHPGCSLRISVSSGESDVAAVRVEGRGLLIDRKGKAQVHKFEHEKAQFRKPDAALWLHKHGKTEGTLSLVIYAGYTERENKSKSAKFWFDVDHSELYMVAARIISMKDESVLAEKSWGSVPISVDELFKLERLPDRRFKSKSAYSDLESDEFTLKKSDLVDKLVLEKSSFRNLTGKPQQVMLTVRGFQAFDSGLVLTPSHTGIYTIETDRPWRVSARDSAMWVVRDENGRIIASELPSPEVLGKGKRFRDLLTPETILLAQPYSVIGK